jgi:hypothetical protein
MPRALSGSAMAGVGIKAGRSVDGQHTNSSMLFPATPTSAPAASHGVPSDVLGLPRRYPDNRAFDWVAIAAKHRLDGATGHLAAKPPRPDPSLDHRRWSSSRADRNKDATCNAKPSKPTC